ncbi:MAG TPA: hypothetical protein VIL25_01245 [Vicinamibacterales bacterium]
MVIQRDRYLDDGSSLLMSLVLSSRTIEMHSLLTALSPDEQAQIGDALSKALDEIAGILRAHREARAAVG